MHSTLGDCGCRRFTLASLGGALCLAFIRSLLRVRTKRGSVLGQSAHCEVLRLLVVLERLLLADIAKEIASEISPLGFALAWRTSAAVTASPSFISPVASKRRVVSPPRAMTAAAKVTRYANASGSYTSDRGMVDNFLYACVSSGRQSECSLMNALMLAVRTFIDWGRLTFRVSPHRVQVPSAPSLPPVTIQSVLFILVLSIRSVIIEFFLRAQQKGHSAPRRQHYTQIC